MSPGIENVLHPRRCALVLIDVQKGAVITYAASNPGCVPNIVKMVNAAHDRSIPVIYTKLVRRQDTTDQFNLITDGVLAGGKPSKENRFCLEGNADAELADGLKIEPRDYVVLKRRQSAFHASDLELLLRALGVDTILFGGIATEFGVESTVRGARDRDFHSVVLSNCCASRTQEAHEYPLKNIFPAMARVMTFEKALAIMTGS